VVRPRSNAAAYSHIETSGWRDCLGVVQHNRIRSRNRVIDSQARYQPTGSERRRTGHAQWLLDAAAVVHGRAHEQQSLLDPLAKRSGAVRGRQRRAVTTEKLDTDLSFERADPLAHGGRRHSEFESGAREIAMPDASCQNTQRLKRGQSFRHASFEGRLQMIVKDCGRGSKTASIHLSLRSDRS
jgi:hypothetical protein